MNKIIKVGILLVILLLGGIMIKIFNTKKDAISEDKLTNETNEYINEKALKFTNLLSNTKLILTKEEIHNMNNLIKSKTDEYYDLNQMNFFSYSDILNFINKYKLPDFPKYENDIVYTRENTLDILENLNLENITENEGKKAIVIKRANLRSFPTNKHFYDNQNLQKFDTLQESELLVNTPVIVIHESKNQAWEFVISPFYAGWIEKENIAFANEDDWDYFLNNEKFILITDKTYTCDEISLDMSVTLPFIKETNEGYEAILPTKDANDMVTKSKVIIPKKAAHIGFLEYNNKNLLLQAFKYEGSEYSWGGLNESVDCSSFVANVYRCFGFYFPRNTSSQKVSIGQSINVLDMTADEKKQIIEADGPCLLYRPGNVMLYLGQVHNKNYIIHASGQALSVIVSEVDNDFLETIDRIVLVK